jgi:hypothetical protein
MSERLRPKRAECCGIEETRRRYRLCCSITQGLGLKEIRDLVLGDSENDGSNNYGHCKNLSIPCF